MLLLLGTGILAQRCSIFPNKCHKVWMPDHSGDLLERSNSPSAAHKLIKIWETTAHNNSHIDTNDDTKRNVCNPSNNNAYDDHTFGRACMSLCWGNITTGHSTSSLKKKRWLSFNEWVKINWQMYGQTRSSGAHMN